ncbi:LysR family transcriptional regulator ArgP [Roseateles oligotrophus]|uniref:LysR family transcriptional regulator ArgP n=1 Tax=Roseateles oligotrophus TaxID=1769250 RepID=A0ABT2YKC2_9BURK|nr:LysR family transcriptional regulator ArgP [Roseateles oligotrophus]MCV2370507.1 LysR family transcriptional regulator ArgP [Roseateles oligotrophus]
MLDYSLLAAIAAVVREGSFERAARSLHLSPSAVSQRVKLLEDRLGQILVVRGSPCVATEAGRHLCRHVEQVGMLEQDLLGAMPALAPDGLGRITLRLAVNADSLATWFLPAAAAFAEAESALLDLRLEDQAHTAESLRSGEVLAAVTDLAEPVQGCRSLPLGAMRYLATASPAFVARYFPAGVTASALCQAPCLRFSQQDRLQLGWVKQQFGQELTLPPHGLPSAQAFVDATIAGLGWGMNPASAVQQALAEGRLLTLLPGAPLMLPLYWQYTRQPLPMLERLTQAVLAAASAGLEPAE